MAIIPTNKSENFLKVAAICSFLGALTTALLFLLPTAQAPDFESQVLLYESNLYLSRLWILFFHPQFNLIASLGVAFLLIRKYPMQIILGTLFLSIWAYTEMSQQSLLIDALNQIWRPGYANTDEEVSKRMFTTLIKVANGISDSNYFLLIYGFGTGSFLFGLALVCENILGKLLGISLLFIGILSLASFARYYLGVSLLNNSVNWLYEWIYTYLQPLVRIGIGIWILNEIKKRK
ncbi:MAG: hypothetical protein JXR20_10550 [Balneola sp.]